MRTKEQEAKRYFTAIGSIIVLAIAAASVLMLVIPGPTPEWALIFFTVVTSFMSTVFGFLFGITLPLARERDADAAKHVDDYVFEEE